LSNATGADCARIEAALIDLTTEGWRFGRLFARVLSRLDAGDAVRYENQLRYFLKRVEDVLDSADLRLVNLEGQPYDAGLPVSALNAADFAGTDALTVDQMIEPVIMGPDGLRKAGAVVVRRTTP
jgi:hypothetical protein